jgi:hypothetical protein
VIRHVAEVHELAAVLNLLPPGFTVTPSAVENLAVLNLEEEYVGWIDLAEGPDNCTLHWV